uniref:AlNc14C3G384 protein n=1 Tax=Albugo laibachii Nc14 TaxID=890382 RepID=F0VZQ5_9STRA|nr:AlNc14C3G384 [Albugo laibachii Nc14]|eukprot:CCA14276.1 AlNc14C3G384 [Albugo laibachii Nc14]
MDTTSQSGFGAGLDRLGAGRLPRLMDLEFTGARHTRPDQHAAPNIDKFNRYDHYARSSALRDTRKIPSRPPCALKRLQETYYQQLSRSDSGEGVEYTSITLYGVDSDSSISIGDGLTLEKRARRKEQYRVNQANYRKRKHVQEEEVLAQICALQYEIDALEKRKKEAIIRRVNRYVRRLE